METTLRICRFDPEKDAAPFFREITVNVEDNQTILDALLLAARQDPTLSFRRSCRSAICGSCAIAINGRPALACQTLVGKIRAPGESITLEPLPRFRQLKDLVVDLEPLFESLKAVTPWILLKDDYDGRMDPETVRKIENTATCILCGICEAVVEEPGVKPVGAVKTMRLAQDPRDALGMRRLELLQVSPEVLKLFFGRLPETCPKGVSLSEEALRKPD